MNIRTVILNNWPDKLLENVADFDENDFVENWVVDNVNDVEKLKDAGFIVKEVTVPEGLDKQLIIYLSTGLAFSEWFDYGVDIHKDFYQTWAFVEKDGKYSWPFINDQT